MVVALVVVMHTNTREPNCATEFNMAALLEWPESHTPLGDTRSAKLYH